MATGLAAALVALMILAALVFVFFELLTPTFGVLAFLAIAAAAGAVVFACYISTPVAILVGLGELIGLPAYFMLLVKYMPRMPGSRKLFSQQLPDSTATGTPAAAEFQALVGKDGVAETLLRPVGAIRIDGKRVQARTESGIIEKGSPVKVISAGANDVVVRKIS